MLEKVKPGDLCIFSNGEQARVAGITITPMKNYRLRFSEGVQGLTDLPRYCKWVYKRDDTLEGFTEPDVNDIVKIIAE